MTQASGADDDDFDAPTGLLQPAPAIREESGVVRNEVDPSLLERLRSVDELIARLDTDNYYQLLGVAPNSSSQEVRRAYSQLAKRFHPDVYFRKKIGDYRPKLDRLFAALTQIQAVLLSPEERSVYDLIVGIPAESRLRPQTDPVPPSPQRASAPESASSAPPIARPVSAVVERVSVSFTPPTVTNSSTPPRATTAAPASPVSSASSGPLGAGRAREALRRELRNRQSIAPQDSRVPEAASTRPASPSAQPAGTVTQPARAAAPLDSLITDLEREQDLRRWAVGRLREAQVHVRNGELHEALNILRLTLTRFPDPRLCAYRDQLRAQVDGSTGPRK